MKTVIVCCTTPNRGLPHLARLEQSNPGKKIMVQYGRDADGTRNFYKEWSSADRLIREWWLETGRNLEFDRVVFIEWDVVLNQDVDEVFPAEGDLLVREVIHPGQKWVWWQDRLKLPLRLWKHRCGIVPLAAMCVSRRCLDAMFSTPLAETLYRRAVYSELRFPTLATSVGFPPQECATLEHVRWDKFEGDPTLPGIWHPVKTAID